MSLYSSWAIVLVAQCYHQPRRRNTQSKDYTYDYGYNSYSRLLLQTLVSGTNKFFIITLDVYNIIITKSYDLYELPQ